jgi:hypothetical protein
MSLGKHLIERLKLLNAPSERPHVVEVESVGASYFSLGAWQGHRRAIVEFGDHDRYSVTLRALEVGLGEGSAEEPQAFLSGRAAAIARRLSYLEEPLAVWELNSLDGAAQLRSTPPLREGQEISYWEVLLRASDTPSVRVARYRWQPGTADRSLVEYPATFSLLGRMADDLSACLEQSADLPNS